MQNQYQIFLEIQRGGSDSRKAWEKQHPEQPKFEAYVNAFDLMKVLWRGLASCSRVGVWQECAILAQGLSLRNVLCLGDVLMKRSERKIYTLRLG